MENKLLRELKLLGLNPTREQVLHLQKVAVAQHRETLSKPIFKQEKIFHYLVLLMSFVRATNEFCYFIEENQVKHAFKRNLKQLKFLTRSLHEEFEKINQDNTDLMNAYACFTEDLTEMFYKFLDTINEN